MSNPNFLQELEAVIDARIAERDASSYTAKLMDSGVERIAQKLGEEGVEVALAAVGGNANALTEEAADLVYHLLVLLKARELSFGDVLRVLERRHSG